MVFSPWLLIGLLRLSNSEVVGDRLLDSLLAVGIVVQLLFFAKADWRAGYCYGPRYLTDMLPAVAMDPGADVRGAFQTLAPRSLDPDRLEHGSAGDRRLALSKRSQRPVTATRCSTAARQLPGARATRNSCWSSEVRETSLASARHAHLGDVPRRAAAAWRAGLGLRRALVDGRSGSLSSVPTRWPKMIFSLDEP